MRWTFRLPVICALLLCAAPLRAQERRLSSDILSTASALDPAQTRTVASFVADLVDQLLNGNQDQVLDARTTLVEPFVTPNASNIFKTAYSTALTKALEVGVTSDRMLVRINVQLIIGQLTDPTAIALVETGLKDKSPAVRYLAAKSGAAIGARFELPANPEDPAYTSNGEVQRKLLTALVATLSSESDYIVVEQLLAGIGALNLPEARDKLMLGLTERVTVRAVNTQLPVAAEHNTLTRVFSRVVREATAGRAVEPNFLKMLAVVAGRNMRLSAKLLDENGVPAALAPQHAEMIKLGDTIIRWTAQQLKTPADKLPKDDIKAGLDGRKWTEVRLRVEEWINLMTGAPFSFPPSLLSVDAK